MGNVFLVFLKLGWKHCVFSVFRLRHTQTRTLSHQTQNGRLTQLAAFLSILCILILRLIAVLVRLPLLKYALKRCAESTPLYVYYVSI